MDITRTANHKFILKYSSKPNYPLHKILWQKNQRLKWNSLLDVAQICCVAIGKVLKSSAFKILSLLWLLKLKPFTSLVKIFYLLNHDMSIMFGSTDSKNVKSKPRSETKIRLLVPGSLVSSTPLVESWRKPPKSRAFWRHWSHEFSTP